MQGEHRLIQRAGLINLQPLQSSEQHLPEPLRFKITHSEFQQASGDSPPRRQRTLTRGVSEARCDPDREVLYSAAPDLHPGAFFLEQPPDSSKLLRGKVEITH